MSQKRGRAWRRAQREQCIARRMSFADVKFDGQLSKTRKTNRRSYCLFGDEKNWKLLYLRRNKLVRARQLGFEYPNYIWTQNQELDEVVPSIRP